MKKMREQEELAAYEPIDQLIYQIEQWLNAASLSTNFDTPMSTPPLIGDVVYKGQIHTTKAYLETRLREVVDEGNRCNQALNRAKTTSAKVGMPCTVIIFLGFAVLFCLASILGIIGTLNDLSETLLALLFTGGISVLCFAFGLPGLLRHSEKKLKTLEQVESLTKQLESIKAEHESLMNDYKPLSDPN
jgi:hypothetical protein